MGVHAAEQSALGQQSRPVGGAAQANAYHHRGTGVGTGQGHRLHNKVQNLLPSGGGSEHLQLSHVLAAEALGSHGDGEPVALCEAQVLDGGGVVPCVLPAEGVTHHRAPEGTLQIAPADALVYRVLQQAAGDVGLLAQLQKDHRHARVLADGQAPLGGKGEVLLQVTQDGTANRGLLALSGGADGPAQVVGQHGVGPDAGVPHGGYNVVKPDFTHGGHLLSGPGRRRCTPAPPCSSSPGGGRWRGQYPRPCRGSGSPHGCRYRR